MGAFSANVGWRLQVSGQSFPVVLLTIGHVTRSPSFPSSMPHPTVRHCHANPIWSYQYLSRRHLANPLTLSPEAHFKLPASRFPFLGCTPMPRVLCPAIIASTYPLGSSASSPRQTIHTS